MITKNEINEIEKKLGIVFNDKALLELAFTHSSYGNINSKESNERLEFLGDSVLHFATTQYLFNNFSLNEGVLSRIRSYVVSAKNLSKALEELNVIKYLQYAQNSTVIPNHIKANLYEAILASIYLDQGFEFAYNFILKHLHYSKSLFEKLIENANDYKTQLQELVQVKKENTLSYELIKKEGPPHSPNFLVAVIFNGETMAVANGKTKKEAENLAAQQALKKLL